MRREGYFVDKFDVKQAMRLLSLQFHDSIQWGSFEVGSKQGRFHVHGYVITSQYVIPIVNRCKIYFDKLNVQCNVTFPKMGEIKNYRDLEFSRNMAGAYISKNEGIEEEEVMTQYTRYDYRKYNITTDHKIGFSENGPTTPTNE